MGSVSKYGIFGTVKRVKRRKAEKSKISKSFKLKNNKDRQSTYDIQIDGSSDRNRGNSDRLFKGNKIRIDEEVSKDKNKESRKNEKDVTETKKINPNLVSFDHELTDFEYKLHYLNLKDLTGSEYGRLFPPVRSKLVVIDEEGRKFSAIRAGNNQISGDILQFLNTNGLKPGDKISFEYDREEKSDEGKAILHLKKKE